MITIKARKVEPPKPVVTLKQKDPLKFRERVKAKPIDKFAGCVTNDTKLLVYLNQFQEGKITLLNGTEIKGFRKVVFGVTTYYNEKREEIPMGMGFLPTEINTYFHQHTL